MFFFEKVNFTTASYCNQLVLSRSNVSTSVLQVATQTVGVH